MVYYESRTQKLENMVSFAPEDPNAAKKYIPKFKPPSGRPSHYYAKGLNGGDNVYFPANPNDKKTGGLYPFFTQYEGKSGQLDSDEKDIPIRSNWRTLRGYIHSFTPVYYSEEDRKTFPDFVILMRDDVSGEYFKIESSLSGSFTESVLISLQDDRVQFDKPFSLSAYVKKPNAQGRSYVNFSITQDHLGMREDFKGLPKTFYVPVVGKIPTRKDSGTGKDVKNWDATDWGDLFPNHPPEIKAMGLRLGLISHLNGLAIAAHGTPPTDSEILSMINGDEEGGYDEYEEGYQEEAYSAPQTPPVMSFGSTQQPAPQATPANAMGTVIQNPGAAPNPDDIPF